ncbi:MAG: hybrid sensor histidine kinase/response regulator [Candidatus Sericytochromatia bacterium]|nr:hybrid sensor histidine kinase/response regulator [Candidatus Tanganyikabacteria bacterium]
METPIMRDQRPRVLAIDDNEDNLALLEGVLDSCDLTLAGSGPAGLEIARSSHPDLILLDIQMPGMDGFSVLQALRADDRTARIPVVLLTAAYRDAESIARGLELGAAEYLTKPIQAEELRVRVGAVLRSTASERELARLRRDFSSMLLHDLRTPLESVRLAVSLLGGQAPEDRRKELVAMANGGLIEVVDLVEGLIEGYRLDEGELVLDRRDVNISQLAAAIVSRFALIAKQRQMRILPEIAPPDLRAYADERILRRVLNNLVGNALKYAEPGDIRVRAVIEGRRLKVEVIDSGPGMEPEVRDRAFDRFFHQGRRRDKHQGGFGLGLAFCKQAVEAHGGEIGIDSAQGRGTRVWLFLPCRNS